MTEEEAYVRLQKLLSLSELLIESGQYSLEEIIDEICNRAGK
jgi:hypothetical protein